MRVGFVGLGTMGSWMARHAQCNGFDVSVYNRTRSRAEPFAKAGFRIESSIAEMAESCEIVVMCVARNEDVTEVTRALMERVGSGTASELRCLVDHSTIEPSVAQQLAEEAAERSVMMLDAPVTGGSKGAEMGTLTSFVGGSPLAFDAVLPVLKSYCKTAELVGPAGTGQEFKMANQIAVAGSIAGLCESLAYAHQVGLDLETVLRLVGSGAGGSWSFEHYGPKILNRDWSPGFSVQHQCKDLEYALGAARDAQLELPVASNVMQQMQRMQEAGWDQRTTVSLFEWLIEQSGFLDAERENEEGGLPHEQSG